MVPCVATHQGAAGTGDRHPGTAGLLEDRPRHNGPRELARLAGGLPSDKILEVEGLRFCRDSSPD